MQKATLGSLEIGHQMSLQKFCRQLNWHHDQLPVLYMQSKDELMIEELIAEEHELQVLTKHQAVTEDQQTQRLRQKQHDELIDELVSHCSD